jgi:hypothetical protein
MGFDLADLNPYDFRAPVVDPGRFVDRREELAALREYLRRVAKGGSAQVLVVGDTGLGKTSVLNAAAALASEEGVLVARLDLDDGVVARPLVFFRAVFDAVITALVEAGALASDDPRYLIWLQQVDGGDADVPAERWWLRLGALVASSGGESAGVQPSPSLLAHDCQRLADLAVETGSAIALLIDEATLLVGRGLLLQMMSNLIQGLSGWMLVLAAEPRLDIELGELFSPLPRRFARVELSPFAPRDVHQLVIWAPLLFEQHSEQRGEEEGWLSVGARVSDELFKLSQGRPYELILFCHCIWRVVAEAGGDEFCLSRRALDLAIDELVKARAGAHVPEQALIAVRALSPAELALAARIAAYEHLTAAEIARLRLFPEEFTEDEFEHEHQHVLADIDALRALDLATVEDDRFLLNGGWLLRLYLKYAAGPGGVWRHDYGEPLRLRLLHELGHAFATDLVVDGREQPSPSVEQIAVTFSAELCGLDDDNDRIDEMAVAVASGDTSQLDLRALDWLREQLSDTAVAASGDARPADGVGIFAGFVATVDGSTPGEAPIRARLECVSCDKSGRSNTELEAAARTWFGQHEAALSMYGITVEQIAFATITPGA